MPFEVKIPFPFRPLLPLVNKELAKCIRCGECRCVCPVFQETFSERHTARGRLQILEALAKGLLEPTASVREAIDNCLLCAKCADVCENKVNLAKAVLAAREIFAQNMGMPLSKKLLSAVLSQPSPLLRTEAKFALWLQYLMCKKNPEHGGLHLRYATALMDRGQYLPQIADVPFTAGYSKRIHNKRERVIFFAGCLINFAMRAVADSLVIIFDALGIDVLAPSAQVCCGMPMVACGDVGALARQAEKNEKALADSDTVKIITACASCGHMLKYLYPEMLRAHTIHARVRKMADRTVDAAEYLVHDIGISRLREIVKSPINDFVTWHDPCHLSPGQSRAAPRLLLELATGGNVKEMNAPDACCGFGGSYCFGNMSLSKKIQARKITDAVQTGTTTIGTACPGCMVQLADGLGRQNVPAMRVRHVLEILACTVAGSRQLSNAV
ncbi:MAG: (Fe-S)-binding protein [Desulfovibrio sp.]|jgi:glycolate oxidase iron-sulfur subunit|nr:(Fe-S)-binding protein [Desulfovibrio sp.]